MKNKYYVYKLYDPSVNTPFYIGKGSGARWKEHLKEAHRPVPDQSNIIKCDTIRRIEKEGNEVRCEKIYCESEAAAYQLEQDLISVYGKKVDGTGCLTNIQDGGRNGSICREVYAYDRSTGELKGRYPSITIAASNLDVLMGDISMCMNGNRQSVKGYTFKENLVTLPETSLKRNIVLYFIAPTKMFKVQEFDSQYAVADYTNVRQSVIANAIKNKRVFNKWWLACYVNEIPPIIYRDLYYSYCKDGTPHCCFFSLSDIKYELGAERSSIYKCLDGRIKTSKGYIWKKETIGITYNP